MFLSNIKGLITFPFQCAEELAYTLGANVANFDPAHVVANGFDFEAECRPNPGPGVGNRGELECCGTYPARFPYYNRNGERQSCKNGI